MKIYSEMLKSSEHYNKMTLFKLWIPQFQRYLSDNYRERESNIEKKIKSNTDSIREKSNIAIANENDSAPKGIPHFQCTNIICDDCKL